MMDCLIINFNCRWLEHLRYCISLETEKFDNREENNCSVLLEEKSVGEEIASYSTGKLPLVIYFIFPNSLDFHLTHCPVFVSTSHIACFSVFQLPRERSTVSFNFHRSVGYYVMQVYAPDVLVVAISWTLFWMDKNARPKVELLNIPQRHLENFYFHTSDVLLSICIFKT